MTDEQKKAFERYEILKIEAKGIEEELGKLKVILVPLVPEDKKMNGKLGFFVKKMRPKWTYTNDTQRKMKEIEEIQASEIAKGEAKNDPTWFIEWRQNKKEDEQPAL